MARKKKGEAAPGAPEGEKAEKADKPKGKGNLVPAVVLAVGLLGGGYFMSQGGGKAASAAEAPTTSTIALGEVVKLDPVTLNLADGHFLKVTMALQLGKGGVAAELTKSGRAARAANIALTVLQHKTLAELTPPAARQEAQDEISTKVHEAFGEEVVSVYWLEFVMQ
jgi:flagellar FliL protein